MTLNRENQKRLPDLSRFRCDFWGSPTDMLILAVLFLFCSKTKKALVMGGQAPYMQ